jgi:hypothetical protein
VPDSILIVYFEDLFSTAKVAKIAIRSIKVGKKFQGRAVEFDARFYTLGIF